MNKTRVIVHASIALLLSLTAGFLILTWLQGQSKKRPPDVVQEAAPEFKLAVSLQALPRGAKLGADMFKMVPFYEQSAPPGAFTDTSLLEGRVLAVAVGPNEPVTEDKLLPPGATAGLSALITPGMRAVAVKGNKVMALGGLIVPGARVDVVMTVDDPLHQNRKLTKIVLENVLVLAAGSAPWSRPRPRAAARTPPSTPTPWKSPRKRPRNCPWPATPGN